MGERKKRRKTHAYPRDQRIEGRWSQRVAEKSNALDLEKGVFTLRSPRAIALSLKRSAEKSGRRRSTPFRSAMSMLNFYINRVGRNLPADRLSILERAKVELRKAFGREPGSRVAGKGSTESRFQSNKPGSVIL